MALIDKASLLFVPSVVAEGKVFNVLPSGNRAPDSTDQNSGYDQTRADFDFDRGSNAAATRIDENGVLQKYRENLFTQSNNFSDSDWLQVNTTLTSGQSGYDGSSNAWKIEATSTGTIRLREQKSISANSVITMSLYAKIGNVDFIKFNLLTSGTNSIVTFDLTDGTTYASNAIDEKWESVGNGWVRISATFINSLEITEQRIEVRSEYDLLSAPAGSFVYIQNAQLESGLVATDYLNSTDVTAKAGVLVDLPRINYDANGENGNLLLEPSRANLAQYSEYFEGWSHKPNTTATSNYTTSPEGVQNAARLQFTANGYLYNSNAPSQVSGATYTLSCYAKRNDSGTQSFGFFANGSGAVDDAMALTSEWKRFDYTYTASNVSQLGLAGLSGADVSVYGFQVEKDSSYPTSYIPNHGESGGVTRAADVCNNGGSAESINSTEGVLYAEISALADDGTYRILSINDGTRNERVYVQYTNASNTIAVVVKNGNSTQANISHSLTDETEYAKIAFRYKANDFALYINGSQIGTDTSGNTPVGLDNFSFDQGNGANNFYGNVKQVAVFNEALSDSELATLTTL